MITVEDVTARLARARERIRVAGGREVEVLAVTKGFGPDAVEAALGAGITRIGENYAQELLTKREATAGAEVHFIGRLQSNKVRSIAGVVDVFETVDRASLVLELARRAPGVAVMIQVNATGEVGKGGCQPEEVRGLLELALESGLVVTGLMTVGPTVGGPEAARPAFRTVRRMVDELGLEECSMGMSADLDVAVSEGSTQVRLGTLLFGDRDAATSGP
jgi:PLP dependent protein